MKNAIKYLLLASILSLTAGVNAHIGHARVYFDDPTTGPDVARPEAVVSNLTRQPASTATRLAETRIQSDICIS